MTCFHTAFTLSLNSPPPLPLLTLTPTLTLGVTLTLVLATPSIFNRYGRSASSDLRDRQQGKQTCVVLPNETDAYFVFRE